MQADQIDCLKPLEIWDFGLALASRQPATRFAYSLPVFCRMPEDRMQTIFFRDNFDTTFTPNIKNLQTDSIYFHVYNYKKIHFALVWSCKKKIYILE